jgi:hypothetical protein
MEEQQFKNQKNVDIGFILQRMDSLEKFFPCFNNMIEKPQNTFLTDKIPEESKMKKEERD